MSATRQSIKVHGMTCQHCARAVKELIEEVPNVEKVEVSLDNAMATFESTSDAVPKVIDNINTHGGYKAST